MQKWEEVERGSWEGLRVRNWKPKTTNEGRWRGMKTGKGRMGWTWAPWWENSLWEPGAVQRHSTMCKVGDWRKTNPQGFNHSAWSWMVAVQREWCSHEDSKCTQNKHVFNTRKANSESLAARPLPLNAYRCASTSLQDISTLQEEQLLFPPPQQSLIDFQHYFKYNQKKEFTPEQKQSVAIADGLNPVEILQAGMAMVWSHHVDALSTQKYPLFWVQHHCGGLRPVQTPTCSNALHHFWKWCFFPEITQTDNIITNKPGLCRERTVESIASFFGGGVN